jgi:hypothetical protein
MPKSPVEKSLQGFSFCPNLYQVSFQIYINYDFEPIVTKPSFLLGNWGYFYFRREKDESLLNDQTSTARNIKEKHLSNIQLSVSIS